jgi:hypothetical protein
MVFTFQKKKGGGAKLRLTILKFMSYIVTDENVKNVRRFIHEGGRRTINDVLQLPEGECQEKTPTQTAYTGLTFA